MASYQSELASDIQQVLAMTRYPACADEKAVALAVHHLQGVQALKDKIVAFFKPMKEQAHRAHKTICNAEKEHLDPVAAAEVAIKNAILVYKREAERQAEVERKRREDELRKIEEDRRLAQASTLEALAEQTGDDSLRALADQTLSAPIEVAVAPAAPVVAAKGVSFSKRKKARVTDLKALCAAIGAGTVPLHAVEPNMPWLNSMAKNLGADLRYPGVVVEDDDVLSSRRNVASASSDPTPEDFIE